MKKLSREEFNDRMLALAKAKKIFIDSGMTNNITVAFDLYQDVLAERERPLQLDSREQAADQRPSFGPPKIIIPVDVELEKPTCPDCDEVLALREAMDDEKKEGYLSAWVCNKCGYEGLSEKSVMRWIRELPEKGAEEVIVEGRIKKEDLSGG